VLTSESQFCAALRAFPVIPHEALVHATVRPGYPAHVKHLLGQKPHPGACGRLSVGHGQNWLGVAHPPHGLDRRSRHRAVERGQVTRIHNLNRTSPSQTLACCKYSRASLIRTNWDSGMFGLVNFRINRVLQSTRPGKGIGRASTR
jgi:hypothetical protein